MSSAGFLAFLQTPLTKLVVANFGGNYFWVNAGFIFARVPLVLVVWKFLRPDHPY